MTFARSSNVLPEWALAASRAEQMAGSVEGEVVVILVLFLVWLGSWTGEGEGERSAGEMGRELAKVEVGSDRSLDGGARGR